MQSPYVTEKRNDVILVPKIKLNTKGKPLFMKEERKAACRWDFSSWNLNWKMWFMKTERFVNAYPLQKICKLEKLLKDIYLFVL